MKNEKDKELDDFFRKGLHDPVDPVFRDNDWSSLEQMLQKSKKPKGMVYWLPYISSIAALLLLFLGWWSFRPKQSPQSQSQVATVPHKQSASQSSEHAEIAKSTGASDKNINANPSSAAPGKASIGINA